MEPKRQNADSPFRRFESLARRLANVPKKEADAKLQDWRRTKKQNKRTM